VVGEGARVVDGHGRIRILVIDDDGPVLQLLREVFEAEGYEVSTLQRPPRDLTELTLLNAHLLVLDLQFYGGEDGAALLAALKSDPATSDVPVLVCSAAAQLAERLRPDLERWSCGFIAKPFDLDDLLAAVRRCLEGEGRAQAAG
jgi:DNA-binding response OmpR family regulator